MNAQGMGAGDARRNETVLIRAARDGDRIAYGELWRRHSRAAVDFVRPLARSDAEDAVAEAFASIWEQLQRGVGPSDDFRPYLFTVARNITARTYRERQRQLTNFEIEGDPIAGSDEVSSLRDEQRSVLAAFSLLPERWQRVLWLTEVEEVPRGRVAEHLGLTPNAVSVMTRRAREGLRLAWLRHHLPAESTTAHPKVVADLPKYVRGRLSSQRTHDLRAHLSSCTHCARLLADIKREDRRLGSRGLIALLVGTTAVAGGALGDSITGTMASVRSAAGGMPPGEGSPGPAGKPPSGEIPVFARTVSSAARHSVALGGTAAVAATVVLGLISAATLSPLDIDAPGKMQEAAGPTGSAVAEGTSDAAAAGGLPEPEEAQPEPPARLASGTGAVPGTSNDAPVAPAVGGTPAAQRPGTPGSGEPAFTVRAIDSRDGSIAPRLVGEALPSSAVVVEVGAQRLQTAADASGAWGVDLAALPLPVGAHEAIASQPGTIGAATHRIGFTLSVPQALLETWPPGDPKQPPVFPPFVVTFSGIPGADVCPSPYSRMWGPLTLDASGTVTSPMFYAWPARSFGYSYCDGARVGPSEAVFANL